MSRKREVHSDKHREQMSEDPDVDAVGQINQDIGLLGEMLKLLRVASMKGGEEWWDVSLAYATDEMLIRL
ncbi:MAG TPA: hypothetical protein VN328_09700 [Thermodesulfovibrionales bacterium]|nr:hypothetical protein [Thermodesulfovibrionales bacterium]